MKRKSHQKGRTSVNLFILVSIIIAGSVFALSPYSPTPKLTSTSSSAVPLDNPAQGTNQTLQLRTISFITSVPTPTSGDACNHDSGKQASPDCDCPQYLIECKNQECTTVYKSGESPQDTHDCASDPNKSRFFDLWCRSENLTGKQDGLYCLGKPVIYLYPTKLTSVDISVQTPGTIIKSDPPYLNGWNDVLAHPDGSLQYKNKMYHELFYETSINTIQKPTNGITIPMNVLQPQLNNILMKLGLLPSERQEFLDFWIPKLEALHSPYILFSLIDPSEKEHIDHVNINPRPDTRIEFLGYFKPLSIPFDGTVLQLPPIPQRKGFTEVEWGATIDTSGSPIKF